MTGMSVLSVNAGADTAGQGVRMKQAFDKHAPDWPFHSIARNDTYIKYPIDLPWDGRVKGLWADADVVHLHNNFQTAQMFERRAGDKPAVIHHHGTMFRFDRTNLLGQTRKRGAIGIVSTLDLYLIAPDELEWLPAPYDVDWLATLRTPIDDGLIRIGSAPTNRQIKSTDAFLLAVDQLKADGYPIELVLIEREDWETCLARKATVDIFFDQVLLGFGCNALEAWGMSIPVVAGAADKTLDEYERRFGYLPFHHATPETIYDALRELCDSPDLRARMGAVGNRYVREFHDDRKTVAQLQALYTRAADQYGRKAA